MLQFLAAHSSCESMDEKVNKPHKRNRSHDKTDRDESSESKMHAQAPGHA